MGRENRIFCLYTEIAAVNMSRNTSTSILLLWFFNATFMIAGTVLNSVVIISLWRSSQLRKKLCYFMILVLSCFDLGVVTITHPLQIFSAIAVNYKRFDTTQEHIRWYTSITLQSFLMLAVFILNIERFIALTYPYFHHRSVTKARLISLLTLLMILQISLVALSSLDLKKFTNLLAIISFVSSLLLSIYQNYKIFKIAKSKWDKETPATPRDRNRILTKKHLKTISTCSLTVVCYCVCSFPHMLYSILRLTVNMSESFQKIILFNIWASTFVSFNSTFNCLIFFWRNSILRREGINTVKNFWPTRS